MPTESPDESEFHQCLMLLVEDVHSDTDTILACVDWLREHPHEGRILIGDLTHGY